MLISDSQQVTSAVAPKAFWESGTLVRERATRRERRRRNCMRSYR